MAESSSVRLPEEVRAARDAILERFAAAWADGRRPALEDFLPAEPELRRAVLPRLAALDLERRLASGEGQGVSSYRDRRWFAELAQEPGAVAALLCAEIEFRGDRSPAAREAVLRAFPEHRAAAEAQLAAAATHHVPAPTAADLPERFGKYRIVRRLGRGNMGVVYLAHDPDLDRDVALKTPHERSGTYVERFLREARAAAPLHHSNLCPVYDAGVIDGTPYLTMAYVPGARTLTAAYPPPAPPHRAADVVRRLALALAEAHRAGVIHRDLKPDNILVGERGEPMIADFGLARRSAPGAAGITMPGAILGTPCYMPPEQAGGDPSAHGPAGDIYSLGVILYELLAGRLPFTGSFESVIHQVVHAEPPPPSDVRPEVDRALSRICLKAMSKRAEARFADMTGFADALAAWLDGPPPPSEPAPPPPDPRTSERVLRVLREWGWNAGLDRLKEAAEKADPEERAALRVALGWLAGDRGRYEEAAEALGEARAGGDLAGWALAGRAMAEQRRKHYHEAANLLDLAAEAARPDDAALGATIAHLRGALAHHAGRADEALAYLHEALEAFGRDHFGAGRVLDTLGMVHAGRDNFPAACEFYAESLRLKKEHHDRDGEAVTHGQLGRLHLDWGALDEADQHFREGLDAARRTGDVRGQAQLLNHRGQVMLARGRPADALPLLDESIRTSAGRHAVVDAYARKDRALARLVLGDTAAARADCEEAERRFESAAFAEGVFHVRGVRGRLAAAEGRADEAVRLLTETAAYFEDTADWAQAARVRRDLARALLSADPGAAAHEFAAAAASARRARRIRLAEAIEQERGRCATAVSAVRGGPSTDETAVAHPDERVAGAEEEAAVLAVELRREAEPDAPAGALRLARAHLLLDLATALAAADMTLDHHTDGGWVALAAGPGHVRRAASAALAVVRQVAEHNRPRRLLGLPPWHMHAALDVGVVFRGPAAAGAPGASGAAVSQAARLAAESEPGRPCVTRIVRERAGAGFLAVGPRAARSAAEVWELVP